MLQRCEGLSEGWRPSHEFNMIEFTGLGIGNLQHDRIEPVVKEAVGEGIRLIDTAFASRNEHILAKALKSAGEPGDDVNVLTKVWYTHLGYERTKLSVKESAANLGGKYPDIVILHWPRCNDAIEWMNCAGEEQALPEAVKKAGPPPSKDSWKESWRALEEMYTEGLVKVGGLHSNISFLMYHSR